MYDFRLFGYVGRTGRSKARGGGSASIRFPCGGERTILVERSMFESMQTAFDVHALVAYGEESLRTRSKHLQLVSTAT